MNKTHIFIFSFMICSFFTLTAYSQNEKNTVEDANYYFSIGEYRKAYALFDKLYTKSPKNLDYKFKLGYCCLFYPEKKLRGIEIFEDIKREGKAKDVDYYLGKAYHINYRFDDGIKHYEAYLATIKEKVKPAEKTLVEDAKLGIQNCKNGKDLIEKKVIAKIRNIGSPINTDEMEWVPVISADESIMIFTYTGKKAIGGKYKDDPQDEEGYYHDDVYMSVKNSDSTWSEPVPVMSINTKGNDAVIALSPDGQILFTFNSTEKDKGDIYMSTLEGSSWTKPTHLNSNINTDYWEGSCTISADGKTLFFASERPGGYGGRDIWMSEKVNGDWGPPVNLGPKINTQYDEDAPFIHPDGITMFFSSKGHVSIGGYDIMFSIKKDGDWSEPHSMGIPLNTTEDDRYYVINAKGDKGFFSSDRSGGKGLQDIYEVTPGILGEKPVIALLKGTVYGDDKPMEGKIDVIKFVIEKLSDAEAAVMENTNKEKKGKILIGPYYSNSISGKYLFALSPGSVYKIGVSAQGFESVEEELDIESLSKYLEIKKDFYLYSPGKKPQTTSTPSTTPSNTTVVQTTTSTPTKTNVASTSTTTPDEPSIPCENMPLPDFAALKGKSLNDPTVYKQFLKVADIYCADNLIFKVQIAAYRKPENYKYEHLAQFGQPEIVDYPDGITRFTQLQFKTIKEAEAHRQKTISKGQKDAWIVGFINGKRYTLEELIMLDFLGKSIN